MSQGKQQPQHQPSDGPAFWNITTNLKPGELESGLSTMFFREALDLKKENEALKQHIKRLEELGNELRSEEAHLLNTNGELKRRIKRLEEAGDWLCAASAFMGWHDKIEAWNKAKGTQ